MAAGGGGPNRHGVRRCGLGVAFEGDEECGIQRENDLLLARRWWREIGFDSVYQPYCREGSVLLLNDPLAKDGCDYVDHAGPRAASAPRPDTLSSLWLSHRVLERAPDNRRVRAPAQAGAPRRQQWGGACAAREPARSGRVTVDGGRYQR